MVVLLYSPVMGFLDSGVWDVDSIVPLIGLGVSRVLNLPGRGHRRGHVLQKAALADH